MITEDYVSFETAKLLKDKGFDIECFDFYEQEICGVYYYDVTTPQPKHTQRNRPVNWNEEDDDTSIVYSRPTHQMALKWLRETHNVVIVIDYNEDDDCEENEKYGFAVYQNSIRKVDLATYPTYEEACEAAIKYCLKNLI